MKPQPKIYVAGHQGMVGSAIVRQLQSTPGSGAPIVDGRNLYQPHKLQAEGWAYLSVGRSAGSQ